MVAARDCVAARLGAQIASTPFTERARAELERALLVDLAAKASLALGDALDGELQTVRRLTLKLLGKAPGPPPTDGYRTFVARHLGDGGSALRARYPGLFPVLETTVACWIDARVELEARVRDDLEALGGTRVETVDPGLSDPHRGQRTVLGVSLDGGVRWAYKPRDLSLDAAFAAFVGRCNELGATPELPVLSPLCRPGYGWVPFVEARPCADAAAVERYYTRAGGLLAIVYLLQGTDCHRENLIACGDSPFLIDVETLLEPRPVSDGPGGEVLEFLSSVAGTGLLPRWDFDWRTRTVLDVSAIGCTELPPSPEGVPRIVDVNTDDMRVVHEHVAALPARNVPYLDGAPVDPEAYVDALCAGFESTYRLILRHRDEFRRSGGVLDRFRGKVARHLLRNTRVYHRLLARSYEAEALRSVAPRERIFEVLHGASGAGSTSATLASAEIEELASGDVPLFTRLTDGTALSTLRGSLPAFFERSGHQHVLGVLGRLGDADLDYQLDIVRGTFDARRAVVTGVANGSPREWEPTERSPRPSAGDLEEEAVRLGAELVSRARRRGNGELGWLGLGFAREAQRWQLMPVGEAFYEGKAGIAVFLAALARCTGQVRFRDAALMALRSARAIARDGAALEAMGTGGVAGFGSVLYALCAAGALLGERELAGDAVRATGFFTRDRLGREDTELDVMSGVAGALLSLLSLHRQTNDGDVLERAVGCGDVLLSRAVPAGEGRLGWPALGTGPLTGFSHGAAGVGFALARLAATTGEPRFARGADGALAFERAHFSPAIGNWADLRAVPAGEAAPPMVAWCHGAAGIGLSRGAWCAVRPDDAALHAEVEAAVQAARAHTNRDVDHLCCGNFGRLSLLLRAAPAPVVDEAWTRLSEQMARARREGGYRLFSNLPRRAYNPGFFRGTAGIGYTLLRAAHPGVLPDVLCLE